VLAGVGSCGRLGAAVVVRAPQGLGLRRARLSRGARPGRHMTAEAQSRGASTPSAAPSAAGWPGLLLVSLFAVAICTALAWVPKVLGDPDTYWHIAAGEWILDHRQIPLVDPFSYTFAGQPWTAHEWLSEVLLALAFRAGGW